MKIYTYILLLYFTYIISEPYKHALIHGFDYLQDSCCKQKTYDVDFPVTVSVIVRSKFGGFISSFKILDSVASGKPLSNISSNSCISQSAFRVQMVTMATKTQPTANQNTHGNRAKKKKENFRIVYICLSGTVILMIYKKKSLFLKKEIATVQVSHTWSMKGQWLSECVK